ncbi:MAG: endonuclease III domain-containing protein [Planctomycetota bacterium]
MCQANDLQAIFDRLLRAFGPQHWWPGETPCEVVIGAILTQNTAWTNVERAIARLRKSNALSLEAIHHLDDGRLADLIRPAGTYRVKAQRLKSFAARLMDEHDGSLSAMLGGGLAQARDRLLAIPGVGPETADAILLYAGGHPTFVVDAYTRRILRRHLVINDDAGYEDVRSLIQARLPEDAALFNEYHALMVELGKRHCRKSASCRDCPLEPFEHDETR